VPDAFRAFYAAAGFLWLLFTVSAVQAQETADAPGADSSRWALGVGAGVQRWPYRGVDNDTRVLPAISFENRWLRVGGLGADLKLGSAGPVSFAFGARYSLNGYDSSDAPILDGMDDRKGGVWVGPSLTWHTPLADVSAEVLGDASGHSKGAQVRLGVERTFATGAFRFTPRVVALWRDKKYVDYYYGVTATEARADRPFYEGRSTTDVELGLRTAYLLSPHHTLFLDVSSTALGKAVKDSPLVDRSSQSGVRLGYLYRF
jgi:outer membrane protein